MKEKLEKLITEGLKKIGSSDAKFIVEHPTELSFGDYSTNAGIVSKRASELSAWLDFNKPKQVEKVELKNGFINFYLSREFFAEGLDNIIKEGGKFGKGNKLKKEKVVVEYTDPNPFKEFHIGHLMSNAIGEAVSRIIEWNGAEVKRANYQGDTGLHVAKAIWGYFRSDWREAYVVGHKAYGESLEARQEIEEINKKIFDGSDKTVKKVYEEGRKASLEYFEDIYKRLGTKFDYYFFESEAGKIGKEIVEKYIGKIFEESEGAIIFRGEKFDPSLHTRVFINRHKLPTYEAKDLGNALQKYKKYKYTKSVVVTGNEIKEYFKVMLAALRLIEPKLAEATVHLPHGMLRLPTGKMSSRTGEVITAKALIEEVREKVRGNEAVAIGAIKYMILRSNIGGDIIFDADKSVSTEGDSGVYLQYAHARTCSVLRQPLVGDFKKSMEESVETDQHVLERLLYRFPEVVLRAQEEYAPHNIVTFLTEIASAFNNFYAHNQIINPDDMNKSRARVKLTEATRIVLKNGLTILGIPAPERM